MTTNPQGVLFPIQTQAKADDVSSLTPTADEWIFLIHYLTEHVAVKDPSFGGELQFQTLCLMQTQGFSSKQDTSSFTSKPWP